MSILMGLEEVRAHVTTPLTDDALQQVIDACERDIVRWAGPLDEDSYGVLPVTETVYARGRRLIALRQEPASVTTVTDVNGTTESELDEDDDWRVRGHHLERVNGYWGGQTVVTYVPADTLALRRRALVKLVQLEVNYDPGIGSQSAGGWQQAYFGKSYEAERQAILDTLREPEPFA